MRNPSRSLILSRGNTTLRSAPFYLPGVLALLLLMVSSAAALGWSVGDKVQAFNVAWYNATIVEIGSGSHEGYYKIHYDDFASDQYLAAGSIRARPDAQPTPPSLEAGPRTGQYVCLAYGGGAGTFRWYLEITADGTYLQAAPELAPGRFAYEPHSAQLTFLDGPYEYNGWFGRFSIEREGKTHSIVLRSIDNERQGPRVGEFGNIYCTNSSDS